MPQAKAAKRPPKLDPANPTESQIDDVMNKADAWIESDATQYRGRTFEEGVLAALQWMRGDHECPVAEFPPELDDEDDPDELDEEDDEEEDEPDRD